VTEAVEAVLAGYAATATPDLIARFDAIAPTLLYRPVIDLFPGAPSRVVDIGAGTGRDAAWLAAQGHEVLAVEPVAALREAGEALHRDAGINWSDDRLPALGRTRGPFDLILLSAVWHHLPDAMRITAMMRLAEIAAPGAIAILSLRHGAASPDRPVHPVAPEVTIGEAAAAGLRLLRRVEAQSVQKGNQANGVTWTWLALTKD